MFRGRAERLHFVGIGGIGMSGIAEVLINLGYDVRGSDLTPSATTARLESLGGTIFVGHDKGHVRDADVVVISSAVRPDNPEVLEARRLGVPVIRRAEMLAELMRLKYGIAISGTHGKTTTTSLIATILAKGGLDPTVVIGGRLRATKSNARLGQGEYLVAEADESDGSFLNLVPTIAVVTNIDPEHLDHWSGGIKEIVSAFLAFVNKVPFYGASVLCIDHPRVQAMLPHVERRVVTYGLSLQANFSADSIEVLPATGTSAPQVRFRALQDQVPLGFVESRLIGRHNVQNAMAAIAVATEVGIPFNISSEALAEFEGIGRRFEVKGEVGGVLVVDDYAHHPEELRATLQAARESFDRRIVVLFQPHRFTRTRDLLADFAGVFHACHVLLVADIYAAGEAPITGVHAQNIADVVTAAGHQDAHYAGPLADAQQAALGLLRSGDLFVTMGAGNVTTIGDQVLASLRDKEGQSVRRG